MADVLAELNEGIRYGRKITKARKGRKKKDEAKYRKKLREKHENRSSKLKKVRASMKEAVKTFDDSKQSKKQSRSYDDLRKELLALEMSEEELKLIADEFDRARSISENEGKAGFLEYLLKAINTLADTGEDTENAYVHNPIEPISAAILLFFVAVNVFGVIVMVYHAFWG